MYLFKDDIDRISFVWWSKKYIESKQWAALPPAAKAIYPVIAIHCNKKGFSYPSERTIAILSGRTDKVVRQGIRYLEDYLGDSFKTVKYTSKRGKQSNRFILKIPVYQKGETFPFYRWIFESGIWRELKPTAQALYPVMRSFGYYSPDAYEEAAEKIETTQTWDMEAYKSREYDLCEADNTVLCEYAGITSRSLNSALKSLEDNFLIENDSDSSWRVYLRTKDHTTWKRSYLNEKIQRAYNHTK